MFRLSPSAIALLSGGAALVLMGSLYVAYEKAPSSNRATLSENKDDTGTGPLPAGFLGNVDPAESKIDLSLEPASPSNPMSWGEVKEPRLGASRKSNFPTSSVRVDLAPQRFSDDEIVVKSYVGVGVDVDGAAEEGGFLGTDGVAADLKGKAEAGSKIESTKSLELELGLEVQDTLGSIGETSSGLNQETEKRVQGGLSLKF